MSILGVDVGTTGCKAVLFDAEGGVIASAYREYAVQRPRDGWSELDAHEVWHKVKEVIAAAASKQGRDPILALAVASLGEAMVPVSKDRRILGPSLLSDDVRGADYLELLRAAIPEEEWYTITGNVLGNHYSLTKLMWIRDRQPDLYRATHKFLHWGSFVPYMLGGEARVDYSLVNRSLLFDVNREAWSERIFAHAALDPEKFAMPIPTGTVIGSVAPAMAHELHLPPETLLIAGAHDQCANALGAGVLADGQAMLGMGTFHIIVPTFHTRPGPGLFRARGLNLEHAAAPGQFVSFIYNPGGSIMQWFRNVCAREAHERALVEGGEVYEQLLAEMPRDPSSVLCLPHFTGTGAPHFIADSRAVIIGLRLETHRGELLKGILEGIAFSLQESLAGLPEIGIAIDELRAVGGGSRSTLWLQLYADIFNRPIRRLQQPEAGALGVAIVAGHAAGVYASLEEGVHTVVRPSGELLPDPGRAQHYAERLHAYKALWPLVGDFIHTHAPSWTYRPAPAPGGSGG
ncbi:MAG: hypothetical protein HYV27_21975 [Candidatus Hydrogenedentes bacterium]|nr:hypothetical protein [Candidatus Hydrogenedentota bacterium]